MTILKNPDAPFLDLSFYFNDRSEQEAFTDLIFELIRLGASFTGQGMVHKGKGIKDKAFASITDDILEPISVQSVSDVTQHFANPDIRLIQVQLSNATGTVKDKYEIVSFVSVSSEATKSDGCISHTVSTNVRNLSGQR